MKSYSRDTSPETKGHRGSSTTLANRRLERRMSAPVVEMMPTLPLRRKRSTDNFRTVRVVILGHKGVGKSAITVRFLTRRYIGEYDQFLESKHSHQVLVGQDMVNFEVIDSCTRRKNNNHSDTLFKDENIRWADGIMLVYDVTQRDSFEACHRLREHIYEVRKEKGLKIPIVLVGNKADLLQAKDVSTHEGEQMAASFGCPFLELAAAEDSDEIVQAFVTLYHEVSSSTRKSRTIFDRLFGSPFMNKKNSK